MEKLLQIPFNWCLDNPLSSVFLLIIFAIVLAYVTGKRMFG